MEQNEISFKGIIHTLSDGIIIVDNEGTVCYNNASAARLLKHDRTDMTGTRTELPLTKGFHEIKCGNKCIGIRVFPLNLNEKPVTLLTIFDFTSIKRSIDKEQNLLERAIKTQEKDARNIARILHDEVAGSLTATRIFLSRWSRKAGKEFADEFIEEERRLSEVMGVINEISYALQPDLMEEFGLVETLFAFFNHFTRTTGIKVKFTHGPVTDRFPENVENTAYRIIREVLDNVSCHAETDVVTADISKNDESLRIIIEDKGRGFDPENVLLKKNGLQSMKNQAFLAGGSIEIISSPDHGTRIICDLPLR